MKLYELFAEPGYHSCIATTFGVDFDAYENIALARLRGAGCRNNILVADCAMLTMALDGASPLPRHAGRLYTVTGARARSVFHPKIVLQLGREKGRLIVSSANMTASGMAGNLEVGGIIETDGADTGETQIIGACWSYLQRFLPADNSAIGRQVEWLEARTPWLAHLRVLDAPTALKDGTRAALMTTGAPQGIGAQFGRALDGRPAERLICVSPYWDNDLAALRYLRDLSGAEETIVLLDNSRHQFSAQEISPEDAILLRDFKASDETRFVHAKVIIVQTAEHDHVLYGSANCTLAALGNAGFAGSNEEACLYRALPRGAAIETLNLGAALDAPALSHDEVIQIVREDELPLEEMAALHPGRFDCLYDTLTWWPAVTDQDATIELLSADGRLLPVTPRPIETRDGCERFQIERLRERPAFARLRYADGDASALAVVMVLDLLRDEIRDPRTKRLEIAIEELDGETEVGLWLLDTLNTIEAAELSLKAGDGKAIRRPGTKKPVPEDEVEPARVLSYEDFIAGRRLRSDEQGVSPTSFSGSDVARVRGFLNRILSISVDVAGEEEEEAVATGAFDTGDEIGDGAGSLEDGFEGGSTPPKKTNRPQPTQSQLKATRRRADRQDLVNAVADLQTEIKEKSASGGISATDILRLRAVLTVLATAGWDGRGTAKSNWQILPPAGDKEASWPRLMARALSAYFGGKVPHIRTLRIDAEFKKIPDDILECWGTCLWAANVAYAAAAAYGEHQSYKDIVARLRDSVYALTALRRDEFGSPIITRMMDAMSNHFAARLGVSADELIKAHAKASTARG